MATLALVIVAIILASAGTLIYLYDGDRSMKESPRKYWGLGETDDEIRKKEGRFW